ncbi:MAG TPA: glycosyltransferase family 39 protein, partial [Anaerolineae bacterium]|nr:glycosyltransferase family 39 protein [Anaerolineae bacterium]
MRSLFLMVALLLAATMVRLAAWLDAPPGLRFDEMLVVTQTAAIRDGARPIYIDDLAEEPLYHYLFAAAQDLFGSHLFTLRWLSMALGVISVAAIYALGRRMFTVRVGLLAAAIGTTAFWALMYSRIGLRIIALPAFVTLAMLTMWRGLDLARGSATTVTAQVRPSQGSYQRHFILAGVLFGLSAYTYSATRLLPVMFAAFGVYLFFFQRSLLRAQARNLSMMVILALIIALPMAIHIATEPAAERRLGEVEGPLDALQRGDVQPLVNSMAITAGMFIASGDPEWLYNIPNRSVFDLLTGAIFFGAVILSLRRFRQPAYAFV